MERFLWAALLFLPASAGQEGPGPVPSESAQKKARTLILDLFQAEFAKRDDPGTRLVLIKKLLEQARETTDDAAARFVLFVEAKNLAIQAEDIVTALEAVDELREHFLVDAVGIKEQALQIIGENVRTSDERRSVAFAQLALIPQAVSTDQYDLAKRLANAAAAQARIGRAITLMNEARKRGREVDTLREEFEVAKKAMDVLVASPDDQAAHLTVGEFRCFTKGDWTSGLPYLKKSGDPELRALAEGDLENPSEAGKQMKVGDDWWSLGEKRSGVAKTVIWLRARYWYEKALPTASGISKLKIEKRLKEVAKLDSPFAIEAPNISDKGLVGWWKLNEGSGTTVLDSSGNGHAGSFVNTPRWVRGKWGGALQFDGDGDRVVIPHSPALNAYPLTLSLWVWTTDTKRNQCVLSKYDANNGYHLVITGTGTIHAAYFKDGRSWVGHGKVGYLSGPISDRTWHHVTFTLDSHEGRIYVDGKLWKQKPWAYTSGPCSTTLNLEFGRYTQPGVGDYPLQGRVDDVRIYNRILTAAEIKMLAGLGR